MLKHFIYQQVHIIKPLMILLYQWIIIIDTLLDICEL